MRSKCRVTHKPSSAKFFQKLQCMRLFLSQCMCSLLQWQCKMRFSSYAVVKSSQRLMRFINPLLWLFSILESRCATDADSVHTEVTDILKTEIVYPLRRYVSRVSQFIWMQNIFNSSKKSKWRHKRQNSSTRCRSKHFQNYSERSGFLLSSWMVKRVYSCYGSTIRKRLFLLINLSFIAL